MLCGWNELDNGRSNDVDKIVNYAQYFIKQSTLSPRTVEKKRGEHNTESKSKQLQFANIFLYANHLQFGSSIRYPWFVEENVFINI